MKKVFYIAIAATALGTAALCGSARANTVTWTGASDTNWSEPDGTSWDSTYSSNDIAQFTSSGAGGVVVTNTGVTPGGVTVSSGTYIFSGGSIGGTGMVTMSSSGTLTLSVANGYSGGTMVNNGVLSLAVASSAGSGTITLATGATLSLSGGSSMTIGNLIAVTGTNTIRQGVQTGTIIYGFSGGVTGGTSGSQILNIRQGAAGGNAERTTLLFSGSIQNGSGGTLGVNADFQSASTSGQGAFICLSGLNTFTGPIVVNNSKNLIYDGGISSYHGGWFVIGGYITSGFGDRTIYPGSGYLGGGNYSNTISLATGTILNYMSSANQTLDGVISGGGNIVKESSGTLTLSGTNTYTGTTTVIAGKLTLSNLWSVMSGKLDIRSGAKVRLDYVGTRAVSEFWTNNIQAIAGVYNSNNEPNYIEGTGSLITGVSPLFSMSYSCTNATAGAVPVDWSVYTNGQLAVVMGTGTLYRTNYRLRWSTQADDGGTIYMPGNTFTITANTTLYAKWTPNGTIITIR